MSDENSSLEYGLMEQTVWDYFVGFRSSNSRLNEYHNFVLGGTIYLGLMHTYAYMSSRTTASEPVVISADPLNAMNSGDHVDMGFSWIIPRLGCLLTWSRAFWHGSWPSHPYF